MKKRYPRRRMYRSTVLPFFRTARELQLALHAALYARKPVDCSRQMAKAVRRHRQAAFDAVWDLRLALNSLEGCLEIVERERWERLRKEKPRL